VCIDIAGGEVVDMVVEVVVVGGEQVCIDIAGVKK